MNFKERFALHRMSLSLETCNDAHVPMWNTDSSLKNVERVPIQNSRTVHLLQSDIVTVRSRLSHHCWIATTHQGERAHTSPPIDLLSVKKKKKTKQNQGDEIPVERVWTCFRGCICLTPRRESLQCWSWPPDSIYDVCHISLGYVLFV